MIPLLVFYFGFGLLLAILASRTVSYKKFSEKQLLKITMENGEPPSWWYLPACATTAALMFMVGWAPFVTYRFIQAAKEVEDGQN